MSQLNERDTSQQLLRHKPEPRAGLRLAQLVPILGVVIILVALAVVAWQVLSSQLATGRPSQATTQGGGGGSQGKGGSGNAVPPWAHYPAVYWQTLREQVAQGFHMSVQEMKTKLQPAVSATATASSGVRDKSLAPAPGKPLSDLAVQLGITQDQLHTIEVNAVQRAHDVMVQQKYMTQGQEQQSIQAVLNQDQGSLNWHMIEAFVNH